MLYLPLALLGILLARVQVQTRPCSIVVAQDDLLACLVFRGDVLGGEGFDAVFAAPDERFLEALFGGGDVPGGGAEVAEEAFAG